MERQISLIVSQGTPFERGFQLGQAAREQVARAVTAYMERFQQRVGLDRAAVFAEASRFIPVIEDQIPHLLAEMQGIAEGAGRDLLEIVAVNTRTELLYAVTPMQECTSIAVNKQASADGHVRLAQNWDWHPALAGAVVLWHIKREDGPDILTLVEAGQVGKIGVNAAGLAMCVNLLTSDSDSPGPRLPMHIILRKLLEEAHNVEEAIALLSDIPRCTSCNHLLADRAGSVADVEATPIGQRVLRPQAGVLTHTNHCQSADLFAHDRFAREQPETLARQERASVLVDQRVLGHEDLCAILSDHANAPSSICLHPDPSLPDVDQGESIASLIFDLTQGILDITPEPRCSSVRRDVLPIGELFAW